MYNILWCQGTIYISAHRACHRDHQETSRRWQGPPTKNINDSKSHHLSVEICLKNTYFIFWGRYYVQVEGAAMGSPISLIVANLYMKAFEIQALNTAPNPPRLWRWFVDDTFVVIQAAQKDRFI